MQLVNGAKCLNTVSFYFFYLLACSRICSSSYCSFPYSIIIYFYLPFCSKLRWLICLFIIPRYSILIIYDINLSFSTICCLVSSICMDAFYYFHGFAICFGRKLWTLLPTLLPIK